MSFAQSSRFRRWTAFPRGPLVPRNGPSCGEHGSRATDLSTKNHAGTFEAWFRHLAKSLVQRADNAVIHNCRDTRVAFSPEKQHYITKRQWRHTDLHGHGESMHTCAGLTYPQKRYIDHVYLFHARPETPIYILKFEAQNNIEILIRHDRLQRLSDDFSFRVCLGRMPF
jgi:hypothetical protein